jgi:hypothetical protein
MQPSVVALDSFYKIYSIVVIMIYFLIINWRTIVIHNVKW